MFRFHIYLLYKMKFISFLFRYGEHAIRTIFIYFNWYLNMNLNMYINIYIYKKLLVSLLGCPRGNSFPIEPTRVQSNKPQSFILRYVCGHFVNRHNWSPNGMAQIWLLTQVAKVFVLLPSPLLFYASSLTLSMVFHIIYYNSNILIT